MELWYLISAHHLMMLYLCTKFHENNQRVVEFMSGCDLYMKICKRSFTANSDEYTDIVVRKCALKH